MLYTKQSVFKRSTSIHKTTQREKVSKVLHRHNNTADKSTV